MFPFWAPGSDGWAAAKKLGFHWAPFISGRLGRMGGQELGSHLGSLHVSFLGSGVGWVGRGQESRLMFPSFWAPPGQEALSES